MGIPILNEVWSGIRWLIDFFMNKAPKPIKFIFFLLLLLIFGSMIPFIMHTFGVHCTYDGDVVTTSPMNFLTNVKLAMIDADAIYNKSSYNPEPIELFGIREGCTRTLCYADGDYWYSTNSRCDNATIVKPIVDQEWSWARCYDCQGDRNSTTIRSDILAGESLTLCFGDATRLEDTNWFQSWACDPESRCLPPENYYYEYDTGTFDCLDESVCGNLNGTNETIIPLINEELESAGATLMYPNADNNKAYDRMVLMKCDKELKPQVTIYGIPIFDYKVWLLLMVIGILAFLLINLKRLNGP